MARSLSSSVFCVWFKSTVLQVIGGSGTLGVLTKLFPGLHDVYTRWGGSGGAGGHPGGRPSGPLGLETNKVTLESREILARMTLA